MYLQMAKKLTEDAVRDKARDILGFKDKDGVRSGCLLYTSMYILWEKSRFI